MPTVNPISPDTGREILRLIEDLLNEDLPLPILINLLTWLVAGLQAYKNQEQ